MWVPRFRRVKYSVSYEPSTKPDVKGMETIIAVNNSGRNAEIATYTVALNRVAVPVA